MNDKIIKLLYQLNIAIEQGNLTLVQSLIEEGADVVVDTSGDTRCVVHLKDQYGNTPLHRAVACGRTSNIDIVRHLIEREAKLDVRNNHGQQPLHLASMTSNLEIVQYLVQCAGADANLKDYDGLNGRTPLHLAADRGRLSIVQFLIQQGADVDLQDQYGYTPLHLATRMGYFHIVKHMIQQGAKINLKNTYDVTPLHSATSNGYLDIVKYLVQQDAEIDASDYLGNTPLHLAIKGQSEIEDQLEIVQYLTEQAADFRKKNNDGKTPLELAIQYDEKDIVDYLENYIEAVGQHA